MQNNCQEKGEAQAVVDYDKDDVPVLHASGKAPTEKVAEIGWSREKRFLPKRLRRANEHDCESVVSTYSNLDNHPRLLGATRRDGRTVKVRRGVQESSTPHIKLSNKTGLPIGVLDRYDDDSSEEDEEDEDCGDDDETESKPRANLGVKRAKKETPEEGAKREELEGRMDAEAPAASVPRASSATSTRSARRRPPAAPSRATPP